MLCLYVFFTIITERHIQVHGDKRVSSVNQSSIATGSGH